MAFFYPFLSQLKSVPEGFPLQAEPCSVIFTQKEAGLQSPLP